MEQGTFALQSPITCPKRQLPRTLCDIPLDIIFLTFIILQRRNVLELFFDYSTTRRLQHLIKNIPNSVEEVYAAIAYSQDNLLVDECINKKIRLEWWGLFNSGISTKIDLIKKDISSSFITFYPFAEYFHPKVIYIKEYGLYVGSANMTYSALYNNVEAGVFIYENELTQTMKDKINDFFNHLRKQSIPVSEEEVDNLEKYQETVFFEKKKIEESNNVIDENFEDYFSHLFLLKPGVQDFETEKKDRIKKKKLLFLQEWRETQNFLKIISKRIKEIGNQPSWVSKEASLAILTDQLLHAYYYIHILKGKEDKKSVEIVSDFYEMNKRDPQKAVDEAIEWWGELEEAPLSEDKHINIWGPKNRDLLKKLIVQDLAYDEFYVVFSQNHASTTHARQIPNKFFKLPKDFNTDSEGRIKIFTEWLFRQKSKKGLSIQEVIRYLISDNNISLEEKIFTALNDEKYRIERFGKSIIGELVGWGRPDISFLRNNRVNKGLRCLGYDVKLFSE